MSAAETLEKVQEKVDSANETIDQVQELLSKVKAIEETKDFVDTVNDKIDKAQELVAHNMELLNQALEDYEYVKQLIEDVKSDITAAIQKLGEAVDAGVDGDVITLAARVVEGVTQVTDAIARYGQVFSELKQKVEYYQEALEKNKEVIETF
ncbi:MAG: hypothetical protein NZ533_08560 [Casimicrobiaceae bacterium]|nr:hypothetical protein [Casimicrobiaceae bacterium]MCX8097990.1 hypothetical protein [Casimicrobiaceae bacterium]MDW8311715.1 hypothetical protein [Burkholderiales bacterium]